MSAPTDVGRVYTPDGKWLWTGRIWVEIPQATAAARERAWLRHGLALLALIVTIATLVIVAVTIVQNV